jgi:tryptophan-rich sensory protein
MVSAERSRMIGVYLAMVALWIGIGALSGFANRYGLPAWYPTLVKPSFNPPAWLFGPVWTILYLMIAIAGARLILGAGLLRGPLLAFYAVQCVLNASWTWVVFYGHSLGGGVIVILTLLSVILALIALAWSNDRMVSLLLMPYAAWVSFASVLNIALWRLN